MYVKRQRERNIVKEKWYKVRGDVEKEIQRKKKRSSESNRERKRRQHRNGQEVSSFDTFRHHSLVLSCSCLSKLPKLIFSPTSLDWWATITV